MTRLVVLAPGGDTIAVRGSAVVAEPSVMGGDGRFKTFGRSAMIRDRRPSTIFRADDVHSVEYTAAYMDWMVRRLRPISLRTTAVLLAPAGSLTIWKEVAAAMETRAVVEMRPIAVAFGLGLHVDGDDTSLIVEVRDDGVEIAAVGDSRVLTSEAVSRVTDTALDDGIARVLASLDPDREMDVRRTGVHVLSSRLRTATADDLALRLDMPTSFAWDPPAVLGKGGSAERDLIESYLEGGVEDAPLRPATSDAGAGHVAAVSPPQHSA